MELFGKGVIFDYAGWRRWGAYGSKRAGASWVSGKEPAALEQGSDGQSGVCDL